MKYAQRLVVFTVLAAVAAGGAAGVVTSILSANELENYATALLEAPGFAAFEPRKPHANQLDYIDAVNRVRDVQSRSLAVLMRKAPDSAQPDAWFSAGDSLGLGVVVSANGWVLTTQAALTAVQNPLTGLDVWIRGSRYVPSEIVEDKLTPYVLIKLTEANGLNPVGFGASEDIRQGDTIFVTPGPTSLLATTLENSEQDLEMGPQPAEVYATTWKIAVTEKIQGPIFAGSGDLLAFADTFQATPLHYADAFVQSVIRNGEVTPAALGAYVIDLSHVYNLDPELRQGFSTGALVYAPTGGLAVPANTPAAEAGLLAKDIITAVDGEALTPTTSLSELLAAYNPGQTARLSVVRAGALVEIAVVLGDATTLVY